jgi:hypothetical protein
MRTSVNVSLVVSMLLLGFEITIENETCHRAMPGWFC